MAASLILAALLLLFLVAVPAGGDADHVTYQWDESGYVLYCPCMGRFGNQAAHLLGSMAFAKGLNRTLAVPPWRSYQWNRNVPYGDFFELEMLQDYHRTLPLHEFMEQLAPTYWPPGQRRGYCSQPSTFTTDKETCDMKYGNPFGPFWDEFSVDFDSSVFTRLSYSIQHDSLLSRWRESFPASSHPVLAFKGAPAQFPVPARLRPLQRYVVWNSKMRKEAEQYRNVTFGPGTPYIGVHLRMGIDWERACESAVGRESFMEAIQCLEDMPKATITSDLCLPSMEFVSRHLTALARETRIYTVFVASDVPGDKHGLKKLLGRKIQTHYLSSDSPQLDLVLMAQSDYFVGNCISSFSAFVKRERDVKNLPSDFFGLAQIKENYKAKKTEL